MLKLVLKPNQRDFVPGFTRYAGIGWLKRTNFINPGIGGRFYQLVFIGKGKHPGFVNQLGNKGMVAGKILGTKSERKVKAQPLVAPLICLLIEIRS